MPSTLPLSLQALEPPSTEPTAATYTGWASDMDAIINNATPDEVSPSNPTGLARSRAPKVWQDWIQQKRAADEKAGTAARLLASNVRVR